MNVYVFKNNSEDDRMHRMHGLLSRNYSKKNIDGHKAQEFKAGRHINAGNYVNAPWRLERRCQKCGGILR